MRPPRLATILALGLLTGALLGVAPARGSDALPWCGSGEPTADLPDAVSAFEWHVVYATPSDGADRFASYAPRIAGDIAAMTDWWLGQDSTRRPRFDLIEAPSCGTEAGRIDLSFLRLSEPSGTASLDDVIADLDAAGFTSPDKAYLVYLDDASPATSGEDVCGLGGTGTGHGKEPGAAYALVYLQSCGSDYDDASRQVVAMHEIVHGLGAVDPAAPHYCKDGHVCDSPSDLMNAELESASSLASLSLDVGRDDYYGHSGSWWDTRDSLLLYRLDDSLPPPPQVAGLTATSARTIVTVRWRTRAPAGGGFRVYAPDGSLLGERATGSYVTTGAQGQILEWTVRSVDRDGYLSAAATLRFKVGYGIVDAAGTLLKDTVPPAPVKGLRAVRAGKDVVLRWRPVADALGVRGYRVVVPGVLSRVVAAASIRLPLARVRGKKVQVRTIDEAGNQAPPAVVLVRG